MLSLILGRYIRFMPVVTSLALPTLLPLLALFLIAPLSGLSLDYQQLLKWLPYPLFIMAAGLGHMYSLGRPVALALILTASYLVLQGPLQSNLSVIPTHQLFVLLTLLLPCSLLTLSFLPESGSLNRRFVLLLLPTAALTGIAAIFWQPSATAPSEWQTLFSLRPAPAVFAPIFSLLLAVVIALILLFRQTLLQCPWQGTLLGCLVATSLTWAMFDKTLISSLMFCTAAVVLILSVLFQGHYLAFRDQLTGLPARRSLENAFKGVGRRYVVAMMDVDHFKKFNDTYGHDVGDDVLKMVAAHIAQVTGGGTAYRYGGEEFTVLFKRKTLDDCIEHLEAVREAIADYSLVIRDKETRPKDAKAGKQQRGQAIRGQRVSVTISIGVAEREPGVDQPMQVLKAADKALYRAKQAGRNCLKA
ncbi:GGDEF domain-containing protein [Corallincola spongiicola]|uniref:diguanylate cyclase n=2 Tax=Corallincola spongiicola TaxID=2520508 RepID=A0ABY1WPG0_9GAMM|nr:GGDEF domain-containing protein [Corallincola spongiicola]